MFGFKVEEILRRGILPIDWKAFAKELKEDFSSKGVKIRGFDQHYAVLFKKAQEEEKIAEGKYRERLRKIKVNAQRPDLNVPGAVKTAEELTKDALKDDKNDIKRRLREQLLGELLITKH